MGWPNLSPLGVDFPLVLFHNLLLDECPSLAIFHLCTKVDKYQELDNLKQRNQSIGQRTYIGVLDGRSVGQLLWALVCHNTNGEYLSWLT